MVGSRFLEDSIKGFIGLGFFVAGVVLFAPKILQRYDFNLFATKGEVTAQHRVALDMENDLPLLDVLDIHAGDHSLFMTLVSLDHTNWTEADFEKLNEITLYTVDLAREGELSLIVNLWALTPAVVSDGEKTDVYVHIESLLCPWSALEMYSGDNTNEVLAECTILKGTGISVNSNEVVWAGRGE